MTEDSQAQEEVVFLDKDGRPSEIHRTAYYGDEKALEKILKSSVDVNKVDATGTTALHLATFRGNIGILV
jgi:ankyrin repeat protein